MNSKIPSKWTTHFEKSNFKKSPRYKETMEYFKRFELETPYAKLFSIGYSPQNRSIECLVVANNKEFAPKKAKKSGKAIVLIQNGIHAGEIEGKDACMLLLRDILITKEKFYLLDNLILLVIPILNVDGHERISKFNRPNQNGPEEMGWRTNSWNLNLNRDYLKAETPEIRAFLRLFSEWLPDFFIDNHTTNGADYQYHITYALEKDANIDSELSKWSNKELLPYLENFVESKGFLTAPYIQLRGETIESGIETTPSLPRLSTGYMAVQNRIGLLVETHSLKPFQNRVNSTYCMNLGVLEFLNINSQSLKEKNYSADATASKLKSLAVNFKLSNSYNLIELKGFKPEYLDSTITGSKVAHYTREPINIPIQHFDSSVNSKTVTVPKAYLVPVEFLFVKEILQLHGITFTKIFPGKKYFVEEYYFDEFYHAPAPYEGRQRVEVHCKRSRFSYSLHLPMYYVPTNQRTCRVIVNLLEPEAPDSLLSWGFFNAFFERKEYAEAYVMEPIAQKMLEKNSNLRYEFEARLENDESFRNDPRQRLEFFYRRSPYFDVKERKYPILRVV